MTDYFRLIRPLNCFMAGVAVLIGCLVGAGSGIITYESQIALAFAVGFVVTAGGNAINDFCDAKIDAINKPHRPIPSGRISPRSAFALAISLFGIGIVLSYFINPICFLIAAANSLLLMGYAYKLKRTVLWGNVSIGYLTGSTFLFGGAAVNKIVITFILFLLAMLATVGREIVKDIEDIKGDKKEGLTTLPISAGVKKSAIIASAFVIMAVILSPLPIVLSNFGISYLATVTLADVILLLGITIIEKYPARSSSLLKGGMMVALLAFIVGAMTG
ncbi:MAG: geranylgeranylglycerol-phosphate geranylgeranyltransferase [Methanocellales archaeon]|nr:geranylgeranylglycerol-phosphate geranylgeranyltransferase [Methanocellales archaeon]